MSVTSVALNRCESDHWSNYYTKGITDGSKPFDQMFANHGSQYEPIVDNNYQKYMLTQRSKEEIDEYLKNYKKLKKEV